MTALFSPGDLLEKFRVSRTQLKYAMERAGVKPTQKIGNAGAFDAAGVDAIGRKLADIRERRNGKGK